MARNTSNQAHRLTTNSDETHISNLLAGDKIYAIPYFQRPYKWKPERLKQLNLDILDQVDDEEVHFLGAVIIHGRRTSPTEPNLYEVIDGQQRITTLFLYVCGAIRVLCQEKEYEEAAGLFSRFVVIPRDTRLMSNIKLHPCKDDRTQMNHVISEILSDRNLKEKLGSFKIKPLPSSGKPSGILWNNYKAAIRFFQQQLAQSRGIDQVRDVYTAMLESITVVQIDVTNPLNGPKIFDSLNSRQEPMTIGDLVRNEIFSRVADEHPDNIERIDQDHWQPFYNKFKQGASNLFDSYFFPYGLIHNPNLKKSEVYNSLREEWRKKDNGGDPEKIIETLRVYQDAFIDLKSGTNHQGHDKRIASLFKRLFRLEAPAATYPFLMQLSNAARDGSISEDDAAGTLETIESFLVRRALCGQEPTGLHAVFKRLWLDCESKPTRTTVTKEIKKHGTVIWPTDDDIENAILNRTLDGSGVTKYFLVEFDKGLKGDHPDKAPWLEHVLPEHPSHTWFEIFTKEEQSELKGRLGNLILLSSEMNMELSNRPYSVKRPKYLEDSMFKSSREFAQKHEQWTAADIKKRGENLAGWAKKRWPY